MGNGAAFDDDSDVSSDELAAMMPPSRPKDEIKRDKWSSELAGLMLRGWRMLEDLSLIHI